MTTYESSKENFTSNFVHLQATAVFSILKDPLHSDTAAILNSIVSNSYYGMLRREVIMYLPPKHTIIAIRNNTTQNGHRTAEKARY